MKKTYTAIFNPKRDDWAWTQVTVEATTYAEAMDLAHEQVKLIGQKHGFYAWRLYERKPVELNYSFADLRVA